MMARNDEARGPEKRPGQEDELNMTQKLKLVGYALSIALFLAATSVAAEGGSETATVVLADQDSIEIRMLGIDVAAGKDSKGRDKSAVEYGVYLNGELIMVVRQETLLYLRSQGIHYDRIVRASSGQLSRGLRKIATYLDGLEDVN